MIGHTPYTESVAGERRIPASAAVLPAAITMLLAAILIPALLRSGPAETHAAEPGRVRRGAAAPVGALLSSAAPSAGEAASAAAPGPEAYAGSEVCAACHEEIANQVARTVHGGARMPGRVPKHLWGCEGCHGPGKAHAEAGGDPEKIRRLAKVTPEKRADACLACHGGQDERINFRRSEHRASDVSCDVCHAPHGESTRDRMLRKEPNALCFSCHGEIRNAFALPFHHKVPEGAMSCIDCHNQHGGFSQQQRLFGTDRACLKCHSDKQGPFTFEHLALRLEGCTGCHLPHGSNNPRLLTRSEQRFVCLECHSQILSAGEEFPSVGTPSFHNLTQARYQSCTTCHVMIHGSNISNVFFE